MVGMIDPTFDAWVVPEIADDRQALPSTPLHRAASRLQEVLPAGWRVSVGEGEPGLDRPSRPVLRVRMPDE